MSSVVSALKWLRGWEPLNAVCTSSTRAVLRALSVESDLVVRHLHRVGHVQCPLPNGRTLRLWSRGDDWVANQVYWRGWRAYETEMSRLFFEIASRSRLTLDIGAHIGFYALIAAHANPAARVVAFEPHPLVFPRLARNVELNEAGNVVCVAAAVGESAGESTLYDVDLPGIPTGSTMDARVMRPEWNPRPWRVPVVRLDEHPALPPDVPVDLVKLDIEGGEPQALRGMQGILKRDRPVIFCEVLPDRGVPVEIEEILRPLDYQFYLLTDSGPDRKPQISKDGRWFNWLFLPASSRNHGSSLPAATGSS